MIAICEKIGAELGELFNCSNLDDRYIKVRTPFLFPDGDVIDVFYLEQNDMRVFTDLGETTGWLRMQSISLRRSPKQNQLISDVSLNHNVEFFKGMLVVRASKDQSLAEAVLRLVQAMIRVSDLWFTFRSRAVETVTDEVADLLTENHIEYVRSEKLSGRSGTAWTVDFHVRTAKQSSLIYVLSTGSRGAVKGIVNHVVASWHDLNHLVVGPESLRCVSLIDDTLDVWSEEDFRRLDPLSTVNRWSRPDEFVAGLVA